MEQAKRADFPAVAFRNARAFRASAAGVASVVVVSWKPGLYEDRS